MISTSLAIGSERPLASITAVSLIEIDAKSRAFLLSIIRAESTAKATAGIRLQQCRNRKNIQAA
jgi:hypothetical protein